MKKELVQRNEKIFQITFSKMELKTTTIKDQATRKSS